MARDRIRGSDRVGDQSVAPALTAGVTTEGSPNTAPAQALPDEVRGADRRTALIVVAIGLGTFVAYGLTLIGLVVLEVALSAR